MSKIAVLGAGSWGTALAFALAQNGHEVNLVARNVETAREITAAKSNEKYLPGVILPWLVNVTADQEKAIGKAEQLVLALPSQELRGFLHSCKQWINKEQIVINTAKGFEQKTCLRLSQVIDEEIGSKERIVVLSGPSHAEEVAKNLPTVVVAAGYDIHAASYVQDLFMSSNFRVYTNEDICGVEVGGAVKNVIALATGISDGLELGDNTRAAIMTRGVTEMARLGIAMGGNLATFSGLTGLGDLIVTCGSMHSRNRRAGILLGEGFTLEEVLSKIGMVVEGAKAAETTAQLAEKWQIEMPITRGVTKVLSGEESPKMIARALMTRQRINEIEDLLNLN